MLYWLKVKKIIYDNNYALTSTRSAAQNLTFLRQLGYISIFIEAIAIQFCIEVRNHQHNKIKS